MGHPTHLNPAHSSKGVTMPANRTKIVCTMGPATEDDEVLAQMIRAGMNVARLNFSHGDHEYHRRNIERFRRVSAEVGADTAILVDTRGPEIRTGLNRDHERILLKTNSHVTLTTCPVEGTAERIHISYDGLPAAVEKGTCIFVDDGLIALEVEGVHDTEIECRVTNGGMLGERKGINVPNVVTQMPSVSEQDRKDIRFACEMGVDAVAASFVCDADAVHEVREICLEAGAPNMYIISKVESALAVRNFDDILAASDGIMVARGDLGVEVPPAEVPYLQKRIIERCNQAYKPVITATQMLESMVNNPRPTRAEVTDVANAIFDGTDCVMLSGETAAGHFPLESVRMMSEVCKQAEQHLPERNKYHERVGLENVSASTGFAAVEIARRVGASAILCPTKSGRTARIMSVFRPKFPIIATTPCKHTVRRTNFYWGVEAVLTTEQDGVAAICYDALRKARLSKIVRTDDLVVITAGDPISSPLTQGTEANTNVCMVAQIF